jgi:hypothetical protein
LKGRRKGSVPFADLEDDKNLTNVAAATAVDDEAHGDHDHDQVSYMSTLI